MTEPDNSPLPIGLGTRGVEALSSYIQRLAEWHGTLPGQLLHRILAHIVANDSTYAGRWHRNANPIRLEATLNSFDHARAWLRVLEEFTGRTDLVQLTTSSWDQVFGSRHLRSPSRRWCSPCLRTDPVGYLRLAWSLDSATNCHIHRCRLSDRCPQCRREVSVIHDRSTILQCPWCTGSLVEADGDNCDHIIEEHDEWVAQETGELARLGSAPEIKLRSIRGPLLRRLARERGIGSAALLARMVGVVKSSAWCWWTDAGRPSLVQSMALCAALEVGLVRTITDGRGGADLKPPPAGQLRIRLSTRRTSRKHDWDAIGRDLKAELARPLVSSRSLTEVARGLDIAPRTLRAHEPELCRKISANRRKRRRQRAEEEFRSLRATIRDACEKAKALGVRPAQASIASIVGRPGLFSRSNARRALAEILSEAKFVWPKSVTFPSASAPQRVHLSSAN